MRPGRLGSGRNTGNTFSLNSRFDIPKGNVVMESRIKVAGHPLHPMLIVFPLGLLVTSFVFDIVHVATGDAVWATVSFHLIGAGLVGGILAGIPGLIDWLAVPRRTRAYVVGLWHGLGNVAMLTLFALSWILRRPEPDSVGAIPFVLSLLGIAAIVVTGWLGGEMVDRLGVGVDDGAHLNAPSSLTRLPARGQAPPPTGGVTRPHREPA